MSTSENLHNNTISGARESLMLSFLTPDVSVKNNLYPTAYAEINNEIIHSLPLPTLNECSRQTVLDYFNNTWALTETLFAALKTNEAFYRIPYHQIRHPLIFYYAHVAVFYVNKFRLAGLTDGPINSYFEELFSTGVDEMSWDDMSKNHRPWPALSEVVTYRASVYKLIYQIIENHADFDKLPITDKNPLWVLFMGFEHERIHLETSSVLIRELPSELIKKPSQWPEYYPLIKNVSKQPKIEIDYPRNSIIYVSEGQVQIGKPQDWPSYGWDNEYGKLAVLLQPFRASQFLISNGEFFEFIKNGGYENQRYWSTEGWQWRNFRNTTYPTFWVADKKELYKLRLCFEIIPMQWSWPVDVNFHEAEAYCIWRSEHDRQEIPYRLISEAEHHRLRDPCILDPIMMYSGSEMQTKKININLAYGSQSPVNANTPTKLGFYDLSGNSWEWCNTHFAPLPGFTPHYLYTDFSAPCFDEKHNIILGGSFISTGDEASRWARFHFRRHFFQHLGFRIAQSLTFP
jgi:5-histidylcysteine sulfoxide synthase